MEISKLAAILFTTTMMLGMASASQADLTIFPEESSTEINSFTSYEVEVENIGPVKDVYEIQHNYPGEISLAPNKVELESGQSKTVNVWFNPRANRNEGTYTFTISAVSRADGRSYSTTGRVNIIKDYNVDLAVDQARTVCRGDTATYNVQVTNEGIQEDEFALTTEFGELSQDRVRLAPGETTTVTVTASSEEEGTQNFNVRASSTSVSYASESQNLQFAAETCFESDIDVDPENREVAAFTPAEFDVTIRNLGTRQDEFVLSTDQGSVTSDTFTVDPSSTASTTLTYTPTELGTRQINIETSGQSQTSDTVSVEAYNGMDSEVSFDSSRTVCRSESATYTATVQNTGEASEEFSLSVNRGNLSQDRLTLQSGESEEVELQVNSSELEDGEHAIRLESEALTFGEPVSSAESSFTVENCWDLEMNVVPEIASAGENRSTVYNIQLTNPGTRENTYMLSHEGPEWIDIRPQSVTVASGSTETAYIYAGAPFEKEGEVKITAVAEGREVVKTQTVELVVGEDIEEAIRSRRGSITGRFTSSVSDLTNAVTESSNLQRGLAALILGLLLTAVILYREW